MASVEQHDQNLETFLSGCGFDLQNRNFYLKTYEASGTRAKIEVHVRRVFGNEDWRVDCNWPSTGTQARWEIKEFAMSMMEAAAMMKVVEDFLDEEGTLEERDTDSSE
jgi:hypothetical protein